MAKHMYAGARIPEFQFDTPYEPQQSFHRLLQGDRPVFVVLLRNFGHPITRHYIMEYIETAEALRSARLVCVVRTRPQVIAGAIPKGAMPFDLICDAEGALYDFFDVPTEASKLQSYSWQALKIINEARRQGYTPKKSEPQQLPLTMLVGQGGRVLFAHYGKSLTDLPEDCYALEDVAQAVLRRRPSAAVAAAPAQLEATDFEAQLTPREAARRDELAFEARLDAEEPAYAGAAPAVELASDFEAQLTEPQAQNSSFGASFETESGGLYEPQAPEAPARPEAPKLDLAALGFGGK